MSECGLKPKSQKVTMDWPYVVQYVVRTTPHKKDAADPNLALVEMCEAGFNSKAFAEHFCAFVGGTLIER